MKYDLKDVIRHHELPNHEPCRSLVDDLRRSNLAAITQNLKLLSYFELGKSLHSSNILSEVFEEVISQIKIISKTRRAYIVLHQAHKAENSILFSINQANRIREFKISSKKIAPFLNLTAGQHPITKSLENSIRLWYGESQLTESESRDDLLVLYCPIVVRKKRLGDFILIGSRFLEIFNQNDVYLFSGFCEQLGHAILNSQYYQWSFKDSLTGLYVRRQLDEKFAQLAEEYHLKRRTFCIIMIDFDFFKSINDEFGHATGDQVLKEFSTFLLGQLRDRDIAIRYGGEEFCILLPDTTIPLATKVAERIATNLKQFTFSTGKFLTISQGIAQYQGETDLNALINRVDKALYRSKNLGRNQIQLSD